MSDKVMAGNFTFTIDAMRRTKAGGLKLTLSIPEQFEAKAVALALEPEGVYEADVFLYQNTTFGSKKAE